MTLKAILVGAIGALVETSDRQRQNFNAAFRMQGLEWHWDAHTYAQMLEITGGRNRIRAYADHVGAVGVLHDVTVAIVRRVATNPLPYFLGGLRIAGGLSLIGAVVAEYVAGTGGIGSGLAFRILEAGYRLNIPRMFAALILIAITGVVIFAGLSFLSHMLLRKWHESALKRES